MSEIVPFGGRLPMRESRQVRRDLAQIQGRGRVALARISVEADLQAERLAAIGYVGKRAMQEVALVSQMELQLGDMVPSAIPRLQGIADMSALAMAEVVAETGRRVR